MKIKNRGPRLGHWRQLKPMTSIIIGDSTRVPRVALLKQAIATES